MRLCHYFVSNALIISQICVALDNHRKTFFDVLCIKLGNVLTHYVASLNTFEQLGVLLGGPCVRLELLSQNDYDSFIECSTLHLSKIWQFRDAS